MSENAAKYLSGRRIDPDDISFHIDTRATDGFLDGEDRLALMQNLNIAADVQVGHLSKALKKLRVLLVVIQDRIPDKAELRDRLTSKENAISNLLIALETYSSI